MVSRDPGCPRDCNRRNGVARPAKALQLLALNTLAIALLSATQDIAVDAYSTEGDAMINSMTAPWLPGLGFTQTDVGLVQGTLDWQRRSSECSGGGIINRIGTNRSLWLFAFQYGSLFKSPQ